MVCVGPAWLNRVSKKPSVKADLLIYSNCVTVSGQCLSMAIIISNKMDFNSCVNWDSFSKSSHIELISSNSCTLVKSISVADILTPF